jgi:hypothetical protein
MPTGRSAGKSGAPRHGARHAAMLGWYGGPFTPRFTGFLDNSRYVNLLARPLHFHPGVTAWPKRPTPTLEASTGNGSDTMKALRTFKPSVNEALETRDVPSTFSVSPFVSMSPVTIRPMVTTSLAGTSLSTNPYLTYLSHPNSLHSFPALNADFAINNQYAALGSVRPISTFTASNPFAAAAIKPAATVTNPYTTYLSHPNAFHSFPALNADFAINNQYAALG